MKDPILLIAMSGDALRTGMSTHEEYFHLDGMGQPCTCRREHKPAVSWVAEANYERN